MDGQRFDLDWIGFVIDGLNIDVREILDGLELDWIGLDWIGLDWIWIRLDLD